MLDIPMGIFSLIHVFLLIYALLQAVILIESMIHLDQLPMGINLDFIVVPLGLV